MVTLPSSVWLCQPRAKSDATLRPHLLTLATSVGEYAFAYLWYNGECSVVRAAQSDWDIRTVKVKTEDTGDWRVVGVWFVGSLMEALRNFYRRVGYKIWIAKDWLLG
ncbi:MAG: hypothetical protein K2J74_02935 [Muribaculaceae bacterium]|nr:hypothetical protein [Muribaculaceae bacterium]